MQKNPYPHLIVIALVIAAFAALINTNGLKPGLDLAGGAQLLYQVQIEQDRDVDPQEVVEQVIAVLKERVDPQGTRNLVWRPQAGNRIEIQIPEPRADVKQLRQAYTEKRDALFARNISPRQINEALALPADQRAARFDVLAQTNDALRQRLAAVGAASDAVAASRRAKDEIATQLRSVELQLRLLGEDAEDSQRQELDQQRRDLIRQVEQPARAHYQAQEAYDAALKAVLDGNIDEAELDQVLALPDKKFPPHRQTPENQGMTQLEAGVANLIAEHPGREAEINALMETFDAYGEYRDAISDPNDLIALLQGSGVLEFRIAAQPDEQNVDVQAYRQQLEEKGPSFGRDKPYRWFAVDDIDEFVNEPSDYTRLRQSPEGYFASRGQVGAEYSGAYYVLLGNSNDTAMTRRLNQAEWEIASARSGPDQQGLNAVYFQLNAVGGHLMGQLTAANVGRQMAIVLDDRCISTPTLQDTIHDSGIITGGRGGFSQRELQYLIRTLNAGALEGRLSDRPISQKRIGPELGHDNLRHGMQAAVWSLIIVAVFMAVYYLFWGGVADFALVVNMVLILGAMALIEGTFTLPGIAGIVLTIGMAVDANVLIFERIREEIADGAEFNTAVRLGFEKAFSTIIDANLTTLITCFVLYHTATEEIKGFALVLGIGIVSTLFTALYCSRTLISIYMKLTGTNGIPMLTMLVPAVHRVLSPNVNWVGKARAMGIVSVILVVSGLLITFSRGAEMLDIEFRSGTQVGIDLREGTTMTLPEARQRLDRVAQEMDLPQLAGDRARVVTVGELIDGEATAFNIAVLNEDSQAVSRAVKNAFADAIEAERPIDFKNAEAESVVSAPAFRITEKNLGQVIGRANVDHDVSDYVGGVAIVLENVTPPASVAQINQRIERMRLQPQYQDLGFREYDVIGIDLADAQTSSEQVQYQTFVVVSRDGMTNYLETPETFDTDAAGLANSEWLVVRDALQRDTSLSSVSNFSGQVSETMKMQAIQAMVLSLLAVVAYIWLRFGSLRYGLAAIAALVHDVSIALGLVAISYYLYDTFIGPPLMLSDFKINLAIVAALLTIVGYSLNDTIVVFDRIRENRGRLLDITAEIVNNSINQTISRTVITSGTTLIAVGTLYIFGGDGVHGFAFTMLIGIVVGTYSSVVIAAPILLLRRNKVVTAIAEPSKA